MYISGINLSEKVAFCNKNVKSLKTDLKNESQKAYGVGKFYEKTRNSSDMNDTVLVPRTIFKGYLGFMAGTSITSIAAIISKPTLLKKTLNIVGILTALYGVWAFVRPYVIKDAPGVATKK